MDFLFDIGNVIVGVDFLPSLQRLIAPDCEDADARIAELLERKDEFEAGRVTPEEYFPWAANVLGFEGSHDEFMDAWLDIFTTNEAMWDSIRQLHEAGHRLLLFSNINNPHKEYLLGHYPVFDYFSGGIFSYQTGHIKPEAEIYQLAINTYGLDPSNTAYIDDLEANIAAGKQAGFITHTYRQDQHENFLLWLDKICSSS